MGQNCSIEKIDLTDDKNIDPLFIDELNKVLKVNHLIVEHIFPEVRKQEKRLKEEILKTKMQKRGRRMGKTFKAVDNGLIAETHSAKHSDADVQVTE